jgi:hypothetical protein
VELLSIYLQISACGLQAVLADFEDASGLLGKGKAVIHGINRLQGFKILIYIRKIEFLYNTVRQILPDIVDSRVHFGQKCTNSTVLHRAWTK